MLDFSKQKTLNKKIIQNPNSENEIDRSKPNKVSCKLSNMTYYSSKLFKLKNLSWDLRRKLINLIHQSQNCNIFLAENYKKYTHISKKKQKKN